MFHQLDGVLLLSHVHDEQHVGGRGRSSRPHDAVTTVECDTCDPTRYAVTTQ